MLRLRPYPEHFETRSRVTALTCRGCLKASAVFEFEIGRSMSELPIERARPFPSDRRFSELDFPCSHDRTAERVNLFPVYLRDDAGQVLPIHLTDVCRTVTYDWESRGLVSREIEEFDVGARFC